MMSKERQLLKEALEWMQELNYVYANSRNSSNRLSLQLIADINKIDELLAQPEQPTITQREAYKRGYAQAELNLEREPLSDETIAKLWGESYSGTTQMVRNFARAIEKAHGITGGEE